MPLNSIPSKKVMSYFPSVPRGDSRPHLSNLIENATGIQQHSTPQLVGKYVIRCPSTPLLEVRHSLIKYSRLSINFYTTIISVINCSFFPSGNLCVSIWLFPRSHKLESMLNSCVYHTFIKWYDYFFSLWKSPLNFT